MLKIFFAIAAIAAAENSFSQDRWTPLAESKDKKYSISGLNGSYHLSTNKKGEEIAAITTKTHDKTDGKITLNKKYVRTKDCIYNQGKIVTTTMSGEFSYDNDFAFEAGSIASGIAELICGIYLNNKNEADEKSI